MKKAFIIRVAYGTPNDNWFSWLEGELERLGYEVSAPLFPTPAIFLLRHKLSMTAAKLFINHMIE